MISRWVFNYVQWDIGRSMDGEAYGLCFTTLASKISSG